jgi:predicted chitinase
MALTVETLVRCGVPAAKARAHLPLIATAMREHEITTRVRARMFLAQVMHESAGLRYFEEIASGAAYEGRRDLGNVRPGDGRRFKGRGPIQLTGRSNYTLYGKLLGIDLARRPQLAATPRVGWRVAALFFQRAGCNGAADRRDFRDCTRRINGGYNGYDSRLRYYRLLGAVDVLPGPASLGIGDRGDAVVTMTRRLSFVHARDNGRTYLDGKRSRFDEEAARALRAFQRDHRLDDDGRYGHESARKLAVATERERRRRAKAREEQGGDREPARRGSHTSAEILAGLDRLDARGDRLRKELLERRRVLERALARERERPEVEKDDDDLRALAKQLDRLDKLVHEVQGSLAKQSPHPAAVQRPKPAAAGKGGNGASTATAVAVKTEVDAPAMDELIERLAALDAEEDRLRAQLADRFRELEQQAARGRRGSRSVRPKPVRRRPKPKPVTEDGRGEAATVRPEARARRVRQSKIALARFLRRHRRQTTGELRRALLREARSSRRARLATPTWERAVREAQAVAGLAVTGELDGKLVRRLRQDWPSEAALRRIVRGTPAWRLIPGQLTPNFNVRELDCNDGTGYVDGLMRERGLSKAQARRRAQQLATRLERVRAAEGDRALRVTSAFRTRAYNASLPGAVPNSAHTRGFAADVPPPAGMSLTAHHRHMRAVFERGVGLYVRDNFVHGDFDPALGRRDWRG